MGLSKIMWLFLYSLVVLSMQGLGQNEEITEVNVSDILEQIKNGEDIHLEKVRIIGEFNLNKIELETVPIVRKIRSIMKFVVSDYEFVPDYKPKWIEVYVNESLDFEEDELKIVESKITIKNSIFENDVNLSKMYFKKSIDFNGTSFLGKSNFEGASFIDSVVFEKANFSSDVNFEKVNFGGLANFLYTNFDGSTDFSDTNFGGNAFFPLANFNYIKFEKVNFDGDANFAYTNFDGNAYFRYANFSNYAFFIYAKFGGDTYFENASFKYTYFSDANFGRDVDFKLVKFAGYSDFRGANFNGNADFLLANLGNNTHFGKTNFKKIDGWDYLKDGIFDGPMYIKLIKTFRDNEQFDDADNAYYQYRQVSQAKKDGFSWVVDEIWRISSGYGVRPGNTILFGVLIILVFTLIYWSMGNVSIGDAFYFSITTFASVQSKDWYPTDHYRKIAHVIERLLGWVILSLFIVTLANVMIRP